LKYFYELAPEKFTNVTNGVTPRRWILLYNQPLARLITRRIGDGWIRCLEEKLQNLEPWADDPEFRDEWRKVKHRNKVQLAAVVKERTGIEVSPDSLYDIQVKRIHEYKRQHLNVLHILALYNRIKRNPAREVTPCTFLFGGKAAPGYYMAKLIIKLIHSVGEVVNNDPDVGNRLKVVFFPDLRTPS